MEKPTPPFALSIFNLPATEETPNINGVDAGLALEIPATFNNDVEMRTVFNERRDIDPGYFASELNPVRLNRIHKHLWWAGQERAARALHHQCRIGRRPEITEDPNLHLLWARERLFVKPLPDFLLCRSIWEHWLCKDPELFEQAIGMLMSYMWLIRSQSDFRIAQCQGLLSAQISWALWVRLSSDFLSKVDYRSRTGMNPRYRYGELRLTRINWIWALCSRTTSLNAFFRGYSNTNHDFETFFSRNTAWLATAIVYVVLVLTAMQVGLATDRLQNDSGFQRASYGFTVFSIIAPLGAMGMVMLVLVGQVIFNLRYTLGLLKTDQDVRGNIWSNQAIQPWAH